MAPNESQAYLSLEANVIAAKDELEMLAKQSRKLANESILDEYYWDYWEHRGEEKAYKKAVELIQSALDNI